MSITRLADRRLLFANRAFQAALGLAPGDLPTLDRDRLYADPERGHATFVEVEARGAIEGREVEMRTVPGRPFPAIMTARIIEYEGAPCSVASFLDLSALKAAEAEIERQREALHQGEKLTALGSLLAGVAHELNNPLSVVAAQATLLEEEAAGTKLAERAAKVSAAARRSGRIVASLLASARRRTPRREPVELRGVVATATDLLSLRLQAAEVQLSTRLPKRLPRLTGDADQLAHLIANLLSNAVNALRDRPAPRRVALSAEATEEGEVVLRVADNGPGIPEALRERVFDPFFTTRPGGTGTGVGLALCRTIVQDHGGRIDAEETPGGCRVHAGAVRAPGHQELRAGQQVRFEVEAARQDGFDYRAVWAEPFEEGHPGA
jgi:C4-dicarboxylate-specific signal transduction histidine kinase